MLAPSRSTFPFVNERTYNAAEAVAKEMRQKVKSRALSLNQLKDYALPKMCFATGGGFNLLDETKVLPCKHSAEKSR